MAAIFEAPEDADLPGLLEQAGAPVEDGELLIEREVLAGGKSRAFLGNRPVTMALLREIAPFLGDIHGQHEQQQLFSSEAQLQSLDDFAGLDARREEAGGLFRRWRSLESELEELNRSEQEKLRMADLWSFQRKEIEAAALKPGEDAQLEQERVVLRNVAKLQENANAAYAALYEEQESVSTQLRTALKKVEELARIDGSLERVVETLQSAAIGVDDASDAIRDYLDKLEADPKRLDEIESRLALMERLKRKYGIQPGRCAGVLGGRAGEDGGHRNGRRARGEAGARFGASERGVSRTCRGADRARGRRRRRSWRKKWRRSSIRWRLRARCFASRCGKRTGRKMARIAWSF